MIKQIKGLDENVAAFRVTGEVTRENYDDVILPVVDDIKNKYDHFNFLLIIDTSVKNYTTGAWFEDFLMSLKNITRFRRMALVSDSGFVDKLTHFVNVFAPGQYKSFHLNEEAEAMKWISSNEV
jgi:SpoIIAA-like